MSVFIASADRPLLERHGLVDFESLWNLQLDAVDEPNTGRGGWSSVFRLDLDDRSFYLKRQSNYLTHTLHYPLGEPSFCREFRNIRRYQKLGIPALQAAFYGERRFNGERQAILMTRALDGWTELYTLPTGMVRAACRRAQRNPLRLRPAGAHLAQGRADARLLLSQAHLSAGSR